MYVSTYIHICIWSKTQLHQKAHFLAQKGIDDIVHEPMEKNETICYIPESFLPILAFMCHKYVHSILITLKFSITTANAQTCNYS